MLNRILFLLTLLAFAAGCSTANKQYRCLDDAAQDKIGVLMGSAQDGFITQKYPDAGIVRIDMSTDLISALVAGSCDVAILSTIEAREILKVNRDLKILQDDVYSTPLGVGFNKENTALRDQFNAFLAKIKTEGLYNQIVTRWTVGNASASMPEIVLPTAGEPITIGTTSVSVPFSYEKNGTLSGLDIEIITRFAASVNRPVRFLKMNFGGLIPALVSNKADVIINCIMITPERAKEIAFSDVYFLDKSAAVVMGRNMNTSTMSHSVEGNIVDVHNKEIFQGSIEIENGIIVKMSRHPTSHTEFILPGFVDAHVHIESSMLTPQNFGILTLSCGTIAVVTDPHEIANVMGVDGIEFMIENSKSSPIKTFFTIPSCVPATAFDVSGAVVCAADVEQLAASGRFVALSEMMNVPGVLSADHEVMAKLESAKKHHLPIDGHAPLLAGKKLSQYANNHISTDHECSTLEEAQEKIKLGMKVLIREGSAARNYETLKSLIGSNPNDVMFCTDDSHPDDLLSLGHINKLVVRSIANQFDLFDVLKIASINPILHYKLDVGQLRVGDKADFIVVDNVETFKVQQVYINGVAKIGTDDSTPLIMNGINNFNHTKIAASSLRKAVSSPMKVISVIDGELLTKVAHYSPKCPTENLEVDTEQDIVKIVYINRYNNSAPQVAFCKGFTMQKGAFASTVSHDSHNIIAVGCSDRELTEAINAVVEHKGGLSVCIDKQTGVLPLPIGGIMSGKCGTEVAADYRKLCQMAKETGCTLASPFMTLSFMSLMVIPEIKIGEKGLFSYSNFNWINQ